MTSYKASFVLIASNFGYMTITNTTLNQHNANTQPTQTVRLPGLYRAYIMCNKDCKEVWKWVGIVVFCCLFIHVCCQPTKVKCWEEEEKESSAEKERRNHKKFWANTDVISNIHKKKNINVDEEMAVDKFGFPEGFSTWSPEDRIEYANAVFEIEDQLDKWTRDIQRDTDSSNESTL